MSEMQRERDLVLNPNEYAYVLDKTKGLISCVVGSYKMSLSNSDALVDFNEKTKRFEEVGFSDAIKTFATAPENWYIVLKNPAANNQHPTPGTSNTLPELQIGKKVNIKGNVSFALYPGQMAKSIQGHRLRSNQYILARVYDADALSGLSAGEDSEGGWERYVTGQLIVVKGAEEPFYIPPTGIEVLPVDENGDNYIRDAVTLEKLEYCILKNEQGEKKYVHGSAVVFPKPDEIFVKNPNGGYKFKAIELSDISGIYIKIVSDYEENGKKYSSGEELFITGKDQMIYYPRPEHAIIDYNGKVLHHAIAIPEGEGRYILERKTGNIKLVKGADMYLVNPIEEVVTRRKLTEKECRLFYPGNNEVLKHNGFNPIKNQAAPMYLTTNASFDAFGKALQPDAISDNSGFTRGNEYTKPRTVTIDNKYEGAVAIDVWTGYAVNVISKNGSRKVVIGPTTYLLEYDETLEEIKFSSGTPKTSDTLLSDVYLRIDNNKVSDTISVRTKDFVIVQIRLSYSVDFLKEHIDKWFNVENYVIYLCDRMRSILKAEIKKHSIEDFYANAYEIIKKTVLSRDGEDKGMLFEENGMLVRDIDILSVRVEDSVQKMINVRQDESVEKALELSASEKDIEIARKLQEIKKEKADLEYELNHYSEELKSKMQLEIISNEEKERRAREKAQSDAKKAEQELQPILDSIQKSELAREKESNDCEIQYKKEMDNLEMQKQKAYTDALKKVIESISPELVASMTAKSNAELLGAVTEAMSPIAIANGESIADVTNKLLRGTSLEEMIEKISVSGSVD